MRSRVNRQALHRWEQIAPKQSDQVSSLREAALYNDWLFEHADLPWPEKKIAEAYTQRWGQAAEAQAMLIANTATKTADDITANEHE